jgi:DNA-binding NarL/FixJ family response regulator
MMAKMPARLLVVDQDARYGEWLKHHLGVLCPESPVSVLQLNDFERWSQDLSGRDCDVLMLAASFGSSPEDPKAQGLDLLRQLREKPHFPAVIAVAEEGNELTAVRAMQLGAVDYLPKRLLTPERLKTSVKLALRMIEKRVARRLANLQQSMDGESRSVVLPIKMAVTTDAADAADAKAAVALVKPTEAPVDDKEISRDTGMRRFAGPVGSNEGYPPPDATSARIAAAAGTEPGDEASGAADWAAAHADAPTGTGASADADTAGRPDTTSAQADSVAAPDMASVKVDSVGAPDKASVKAGSATAPDKASAKADSATAPDKASAKAGSADAPDKASAKAGSAAESDAAAAKSDSASGKRKRPKESNNPQLLPAARAPGGEFMAANFIPGYTIHATIGESEKAAVYVATSAARNENVALKVSKTLRDEAAGRQFLEREYTAIVAIRDPSVVQIHDYGIHAGYEYLVMEYLPRGDLKARMQQPMTEHETLRYVAQIAAALQVVHHAGLLHRDLKPPNVMLRENGDVALIDFGLARALDGSTPSTRTGVLRGSPYYMSPEQAMGELLDARSDFYSLGIMYYEMLTGKKPYTGGSAMDVLQQHVNAPLPMLPKALAHHEPLLLKMMAKSREDRFATAEEILVAISARREADRADRESEQVESSAA